MDILETIFGADNCTDAQEKDAKAREDKITDIYLVEYISLTSIRMIAALVVLHYVICRWCRRETFLTLVPILLFLSAAD